MLFGTAAVVTTLGALAPGAVAMLASIGMRLARHYGVSARPAALMIVSGAVAGSFSPLNPLGAIVEGTVRRAGLETDQAFLFVVSLAFNVVAAAVVLLVEGPATG